MAVCDGERPWMAHFYLGHGLGLNSAEAPYVGTDLGDDYDHHLILAEGTVLVIEPIVWDEGHSGYRSENVFVITEDGCREPHRLPVRSLWRLSRVPTTWPCARVAAQRAFAAMEAHDLDVLVLGRTANMRYVSGVPLLWNAGTRPFGPGCVAVRATQEIYLLSTWDEGVPDDIPHDHLFGITWNPMNLVTVLQGIAAEIEPARVGTDAMSPLFARLLPDGLPGRGDRRRRAGAARRRGGSRPAEEIDAIRAAIAVADVAMAAAVAELRPGVTERELTGVFMDAMASHGVTTPATQDVVPHHDGRGLLDRGAPTSPCGPATWWPSTPAWWPTATWARWAGPGRSAWAPMRPAGVELVPTVGRAVGRDCSTPADPAPPAAGCSTPYRAAGEPLPADADRLAVSAWASTTR